METAYCYIITDSVMAFVEKEGECDSLEAAKKACDDYIDAQNGQWYRYRFEIDVYKNAGMESIEGDLIVSYAKFMKNVDGAVIESDWRLIG